MQPSNSKIILWLAMLLLCLFLIYYLLSPGNTFLARAGSSHIKILLIGIDGGSWDILKRLSAEGKIPHFQKLIETGSYGYLNSLSWKRIILGGKGYFSPIVWASIATGKIPSKHGIEDFTLPLPSRLVANLVPQNTAAFAAVRLPEEIGEESELIFRARTISPIRKKKINVSLNDTSLRNVELNNQWRVMKVPLPDFAFKRENTLNFAYSAENSEIGKPIAEVNYVRVYHSSGQEIADLHFLREKNLFLQGWQIPPPAALASASSFHLRTSTIWQILSKQKRKVGVVGWWASWPATPVNGYLVTSYVGHQGARMKGIGKGWLGKLQDLTYPPDYVKEVQEKLFFPDSIYPEIVKRFYDPASCACIGKKQYEVFRNFYWQDRFFEELSLDLLARKGPFDFFCVYFRGIDTSGHQFIDFSENPESVNQCKDCDTNRLATIVENYYTYMDEVVGKLLQFQDKSTVTMIVTDHGQVAQGDKGVHANNGFILMQGAPVRRHKMKAADVLDITPTILYLMGFPVAQDMDGSAMIEAIDPGYLSRHPISFISTYDDYSTISGEKEEVVNEQIEKEELEELKALGYIQ
jgi:predicted AlkP superfamily phosphohydrolase/phosphomutase